jgi:hypothetical protein
MRRLLWAKSNKPVEDVDLACCSTKHRLVSFCTRPDPGPDPEGELLSLTSPHLTTLFPSGPMEYHASRAGIHTILGFKDCTASAY